jgi:hypothetical protein
METRLEGIDLPALKILLNETADAIRRLKTSLRARWTRPMAVEQRELCLLKGKATLLCALRAFLRGRLHLARLPDDKLERVAYHADMARRAADRYDLLRPEVRS